MSPSLLPVDWLCLDGTVIADGQRLQSYLLRGLGGGGWTVPICTSVPLGSGYRDDYVDIYEADPFGPNQLGCFCGLVAEDSYESPEADPAPWYVATAPWSADFLGWSVTSFDVRPVARRAFVQAASGGSLLGPSIPSGRTVGVELMGVATSARGMAWGERWLADALGAAGCTGGPGELTFVPACPDDPNDETAYRVLRGAGLIDGPEFGQLQDMPQAVAQTARFQIAAQSPYLHSVPADGAEDLTLTAGASVSFLVSAPEWSGVLSPIVTLIGPLAGTAGPITVTATPVAAGQSCPEPGANPCSEIVVSSLPAESQVILDHPVRRARYADPTLKVERSAYDRVTFAAAFPWVDVPPCSDVCVTVTNGGAVTVGASITVETLEP